MKVLFKNLFFGPDAKRYRKGVVYDVPDEWAGDLNTPSKLPEGVKILPDAMPLGPEVKEKAPTMTRAERRSAQQAALQRAKEEEMAARVEDKKEPNSEGPVVEGVAARTPNQRTQTLKKAEPLGDLEI